MLIEHKGNIVRSARLADELSEVGSDPQPWQFKQFNDATSLGVEFVWPYEDFDYIDASPSSRQKPPDDVIFKQLSSSIFALNLPAHISVQEGYNLVVFPHHRSYFSLSAFANNPIPLMQQIEADWWPGRIEIMFMGKCCRFEKGQPFAQAVAMHKRDHLVKRMSTITEERIDKANEFLDKHRDEYITRTINIDGFSPQDNLYERLSHLNKSGQLPPEIKPTKTCSPKLSWHSTGCQD
jgi:hypothetical protein